MPDHAIIGSGITASVVLAARGSHLQRHGFELCRAPQAPEVVWPDAGRRALTMDRARKGAALNALAAGDGGRFAHDVDRLGADAPFLSGLPGGDLWHEDTVKLLFAQMRERVLRGLAARFRTAPTPVRAKLPAVPTICVGQPLQPDPTRGPAGRAFLGLQIRDAPRVIKGDAAGRMGVRDRDARRAEPADRIGAPLARHIMDLDRIKSARRAHGPAGPERLNVSLVGGDPLGGLCSIVQAFVWRPFPHSISGTNALRGFPNIGASTRRGPGLGSRSGCLVAKRLGA